VSQVVGGWALASGLLAIAGVMAIGNAIQLRRGTATPGQTTEVAILVMYMIGALTVLGPTTLAIVLGGAVAVLLHLREELKGMVRRMSDRDVRAIMQFVVVSLVVLPVLRNRDLGPFGVLNPHKIWMMLAVAAADTYLGDRGLYATAVLSGLTDIDAITLSTSRLVASGRLSEEVGWRLIVTASLSNTTFKLAMAWIIGGRALGTRLGGLALSVLATGGMLIFLWG